MLHLQAWEDRQNTHLQSQRQLLPTQHWQTLRLSYHHHLLLLQRELPRSSTTRGHPGLVGNCWPGSPGAQLSQMSTPFWQIDQLQTLACAWENCSARTPAPLQAALSCTSGDSQQQFPCPGQRPLWCRSHPCEAKHRLQGSPSMAGMGHDPIFPNYPRAFACSTRPQEKAAAWPATSILAASQCWGESCPSVLLALSPTAPACCLSPAWG